MLYLVFFSKLLVWDALHIHASGEPTIFMRRSRIYNADKKKLSEVELTWTRWSSIAEGYYQWDRRWITFSVAAYHESALFRNSMFRWQNIISLVPRDRSLFIAWGRGEGGFWRDHLIFRRTKEGISRNWEPKRGDHWKLWKDRGRGGTNQICLDGFMKKKGQLRRDVIGRLSVKPWCYCLWRLVISNWCVSIRLLSHLNSRLLLVKLSLLQSFSLILAWSRK